MLHILSFLLSGLGTGLLLSVPIGPANLLCLERTLKSGSIAGFMTGLGATFGDFLFVIATLVGIIAIGDINLEHSYLMKYIGGSVLIAFGIISFTKGYAQYHDKNATEPLVSVYHPSPINRKKRNLSILSGFMSSFILTITNPLTPIGVISAVTAVGLGGSIFLDTPLLSALFFVCGILIGSLMWWFFLTVIANRFAKKLTWRSLSVVNYGACILMFGMAIYILI